MSAEQVAALLKAPRARRNVLVDLDRSSGGVVTRERFAEETTRARRTDPVPDAPYPGRIETALNVETAIDTGETLGGLGLPEYGVLELANRDAGLDHLRSGVSVDGQYVRALVTGKLEDGTEVGIAEAEAAPVFEGVGSGRPAVGDQVARVSLQGRLHKLRRPLLTRQFSPPCLLFPGTSAGCLDFGDVLDQTGAFTVEVWLCPDDATVTGQDLVTKDTGAAGWGISLGTAGSGVVRFYVREQSIVNTDTPAGTISFDTWHHVACVNAPADGKRYIYVDGVLKASTTITGSPAGNAASFKVGAGFGGKLAQVVVWTSTARTLAQIQANRFLPLLGTESGLGALLELSEGRGDTTADRKPGSSISATLGTGVLWDTSAYCNTDIEGTYWPAIMGAPQDVPCLPIDMSGNTWAIGRGPGDLPLTAVLSVKSGHNPLAGGAYTLDLARGLVTLASAPSGDLTATPVYTPWGTVGSFDGVDDSASVTAACPAGSMTLACVVSADFEDSSGHNFLGWRNSTSAGLRILSFSTAGKNLLTFQIRNDAATSFSAAWTGTALPRNRRTHVAGVLDTAAGLIRLVVDGTTRATTAISGTFNTTLTTLVAGKTPDASTFWHKGTLDEPLVLDQALTDEQIAPLVAMPATSSTSGLVHGWHFDEGTGTSAASFMAGNAFALTGTTWTYGRVGTSDLVLPILWAAGYTSSDVNLETVAAYCAATVAPSAWYVTADASGSEEATSEATHADTLDKILRGVHAQLTPGPDGKLWLERVALPTGEPDDGATFTERDLDEAMPIDAVDDTRRPPVYLAKVLWGRNWSPADRSAVAGLIASSPATWSYAVQEWRTAASPPADILDDFPNARTLVVESCLLNRADADAETRRILPFYGPDSERYALGLKTSALNLRCGGQMRLTVRSDDGTVRLGMEEKLFRVTYCKRVDRDVTVRIWAAS
ncbi:MAG TPA: LamG domain-containing protein [Thermoanaerobaculia bacterium]|nr:LamG domain-containing protein [Thermoanaerobaculia bacterium]